MGLFKTPLPPPPGPRSKGSSSFSLIGDTIGRLGEASGIIANIWNLIAPYSQKTITAADGRRYNLLAQDAGYDEVAAAGEGVFQVILRNVGTAEAPSMEAKVTTGSLFKSLRPDDKQTISGLDSWFPTDTTDKIWLGITFDNTGEVTWAGIDSWEQGGDFDITQEAWSGSNGYCEDDGGTPPSHQTSRKLIAYITGSGASLEVNQVMFHDQMLRNVCIDGRPARYPFDHEGGYPL